MRNRTIALVLLLVAAPWLARANERLNYECDRLSFPVSVQFDEKGTPTALYGIITEGDDEGTDPEYAREYVTQFNLKVSDSKSVIYFTVENDFGSGDITCYRF